ncbi:MAG: sulfotransferase [Streptosporangiaceae bacterium]|nr:sulfotransferase [Streptosporangiaceae bacterium]MBV9853578.1 sulfotransferase [Streptosporangiaceae bacterium]
MILTAARSGSTLLRFLLDAHPVLACPPETNLVKTTVQLAATWRLLDGPAELPAAEDQAQGQFPAEAIAAARSMLDGMFARYLTRRGKLRWCEKSLGTAIVAEAFRAIYPKTRFVCLYRHCMDMVASGVEACPWGVAGYGFDPYVSNSPGNNAAALVHYWADHTAAMLEFEEANPDACLRVHYEDLVADPGTAAARIFSFAGVPEVPDIGKLCFAVGHERNGPGDYKIWATGRVSANSVGRGVHVPVGVIPAPLLGVVNELLGKLGYATVGEGWNQQGARSVPRPHRPAADEGAAGAGAPAGTADACERAGTAGGGGTAGSGDARPAAPDPELDALDTLLTARIEASMSTHVTNRPRQPGSIVFIAHSANGTAHERTWHLDLEEGVLTRRADTAAEDAWRIIGDSQAWRSVLDGEINLGVALRRGELRCGKVPEANGLREDTCLTILTHALGLTHLPAAG